MEKLVTICLILSLVTSYANADFSTFVIRNGASGSPAIQANNDYVTGATEFVISESGMKAGWGSDNINGSTLGDITQLSITRWDDTARFSAGSGPAVAPYFNIWVTDGAGHYAVVANEPSNPAFQSLFTENIDGSHSYNLSFADLADKSAKIYEDTVATPYGESPSDITYAPSWIASLDTGDGYLTFGELASLQIAPPPAAYITEPSNLVSSGAPDELGTNIAYGVNWIFGDTLSNYLSGDEGYVVSNPAVVPEPATMAFLGLGGLLIRRKKK